MGGWAALAVWGWGGGGGTILYVVETFSVFPPSSFPVLHSSIPPPLLITWFNLPLPLPFSLDVVHPNPFPFIGHYPLQASPPPSLCPSFPCPWLMDARRGRLYCTSEGGAQSPESGEPRSCQVEVDYFAISNHINADSSTYRINRSFGM